MSSHTTRKTMLAAASTPSSSMPGDADVDPHTMDGEEYLDRYGVTAYMKDMITLLLENQPDKPLEFIAEYFRTVTQGSSPLLRAYRYVRLAGPEQGAFEDNLVAAFGALDARRGMVMAAELQRLLRLICSECPVQVSRSILLLLGKHDAEPVCFHEFNMSVRLCLQYEELFVRAEALVGPQGMLEGAMSKELLSFIKQEVSAIRTGSPYCGHSAPWLVSNDEERVRLEVWSELDDLARAASSPGEFRVPGDAPSCKDAYLTLLRSTVDSHPGVDAVVQAAIVRASPSPAAPNAAVEPR